MKLVKECVGIPVVANGDIRSVADAENVVGRTGVDGVRQASFSTVRKKSKPN